MSQFTRLASHALRTYTGDKVLVKRVIRVDVQYQHQHVQDLELLVVQGSGPSLFGRNWLQVLKLDWKRIRKLDTAGMSNDKLKSLLER
jgi:hypothetical protein